MDTPAQLPAAQTPGPHRYKKGNKKKGGRQKGSTNKFPTLLKECIVMAAELYGSDGKGKDQMVGFLTYAIETDFRGFLMLLGRVLPMQVETRQDSKSEIVYRSVTEIRREMVSRGIDVKLMAKLIEHDPEPEMADDDDAVAPED